MGHLTSLALAEKALVWRAPLTADRAANMMSDFTIRRYGIGRWKKRMQLYTDGWIE